MMNAVGLLALIRIWALNGDCSTPSNASGDGLVTTINVWQTASAGSSASNIIFTSSPFPKQKWPIFITPPLVSSGSRKNIRAQLIPGNGGTGAAQAEISDLLAA
jgi:hypothetical protein